MKFGRIVQTIFIFTLAITLGACASRTRVIEPQMRLAVEQVTVDADDSVSGTFRSTLAETLEARLGFPASLTASATVELSVDIRSVAYDLEGFSLLGNRNQAVVDIIVSKLVDGTVLKTETINVFDNSSNRADARAALVRNLSSRIRRTLGIGNYLPGPINPIIEEGSVDLGAASIELEEGALANDPLLTGEALEDNFGQETEAPVVLSTDTPLLSAPEPETPVTPEPEAQAPATPESSDAGSQNNADDAGDPLCIITVDNDCSDNG